MKIPYLQLTESKPINNESVLDDDMFTAALNMKPDQVHKELTDKITKNISKIIDDPSMHSKVKASIIDTINAYFKSKNK